MKKHVPCLLTLVLLHVSVQAQVIDGTRDAVYGPAKALQDTPTGFGDNLSELDGAYGVAYPDGSLSLMLTGNLENGGNGLVLFIDSKPGGALASTLPGGQGVIGSVGGARTDDWGTDTDGGTGVTPTPGGGSILDPGFNPDFSLEINVFDQAPGGSIEYYVNIIDMTIPNEPNDNRDIFLGQNFLNEPAVTQTYFRDQGATNAGQITHAFNNTNTAGVLQFDFGMPPGPLGDPASASTGLELLFSTEFLGGGMPRNSGLPIRVLPFITNGGGDFLSNQFLPGLGGVTNLGGPGGDGGTPLFDSTLFVGNNFLEFQLGVDGDFNNDGSYNCADIDGLVLDISQNNNTPSFDLTGDGQVDLSDLNAWLTEAGGVNLGPGLSYLPGDATLDGYVDGPDFGKWNENKGTPTAAWCSGDFTADGQINSLDYDVWFARRFTSSFGAAAVPEPSVAFTFAGLVLALVSRFRR